MITKNDIKMGALLKLANGDVIQVKRMNADGMVTFEHETKADPRTVGGPKVVGDLAPPLAAYIDLAGLGLRAPGVKASAAEQSFPEEQINATVTCKWVEIAQAAVLSDGKEEGTQNATDENRQ